MTNELASYRLTRKALRTAGVPTDAMTNDFGGWVAIKTEWLDAHKGTDTDKAVSALCMDGELSMVDHVRYVSFRAN